MREILFRGKRADNGEWVEGSFCPKNSGGDIPCIIVYNGRMAGHWFEINPETLGQYTGITAKGKKIFEGDICQIKNHPLINDTPFFIKWEVEDRVYTGWAWKDIDKEAREDAFTPSCARLCEVIGNIHDNPELLKGVNE